MFLVPSDALRPRRPDEHFAEEARAARDAGVEVALIDHDTLTRGCATGPADAAGGAEAAVARVPAGTDAVYRGWMLSSGRYAALARALAARGVTLRTSPEHYRRAHELPGWYAAIRGATPETVWTDGDDRHAFGRACGELGPGPAVLRDYTKSLKHHWHEAAFLPDVSDGVGAWAVASRFRELRGDDFAGGFVVRRFEPFTGAEVRTWWIGGSCRLVTAHPDTPGELPPPGAGPGGAEAAVGAAVEALGLPFATADLVRDAYGRWRVVEIGDGQVSDRPRTTPAEDLIAALLGR